MGRQRTINDQGFWRSPKLQNATTEDKVALLHLLTCPDSNIIGAYTIVPRIVAAEIGWTQDQWRQILERLKRQNLASYDDTLMFVWVKTWWDHHSASQTLGLKLQNRTLEQIRQLPDYCRDNFICDFRQRIGKEHQELLYKTLQINEVSSSTKNGYGTDTISDTINHNDNFKNNSITTSTTDSMFLDKVDNSKIPALYRTEVNQGLIKAHQNGLAKVEPQKVVDVLAQKLTSPHPPHSPGGLAYYLSQHLQTSQSNPSISNIPTTELEALKGRCFEWPSENPTHYARVVDFGQFEVFGQENGQFLRRVGILDNCDLISAIRANHIKEISPSSFENITQQKIT